MWAVGLFNWSWASKKGQISCPRSPHCLRVDFASCTNPREEGGEGPIKSPRAEETKPSVQPTRLTDYPCRFRFRFHFGASWGPPMAGGGEKAPASSAQQRKARPAHGPVSVAIAMPLRFYAGRKNAGSPKYPNNFRPVVTGVGFAATRCWSPQCSAGPQKPCDAVRCGCWLQFNPGRFFVVS
jgi:hypothetical protein